MSVIYCKYPKADGHRTNGAYNAITQEIEYWLVENVGKRWVDWDWVSFGVIKIHDENLATFFMLKFG